MIRGIEEMSGLSALPGPVNVAIGIFDGVHQGHRALVRAVTQRAGTPVVLTFVPHPAEVLGVEGAPRQISTPKHKREILAKFGIKCLLSLEFNRLRAAQSAEGFVREIAESCELGCIAVGSGFRFGHGREGDVELLAKLGDELGFDVCDIDPVCDPNGKAISSTRIRAALDGGDLQSANDLLGRPYSLIGEVRKGRQLGCSIGFPTANIQMRTDELLPSGVYAVSVQLEGERLGGVANLGTRPTVTPENDKPLLEVHLFDFNRNIYGLEMEVLFQERIRDEQTFNGIEELRQQIEKDVRAARELLVEPSGRTVL